MTNQDMPNKTMITFALATAALVMLVLATQVGMPLRAILLALAVSDVLFLIALLAGKILPPTRK